MEHIIELENTDDMASIRGRIDYAISPIAPANALAVGPQVQRRLLLVVPRKNTALRSLVNMKLLARLVKTKAVEIAIVSNQPLVRDYAKEAGINAFGSLNSAKRAGWVSAKASVASPDRALPPPAYSRGEKPALSTSDKPRAAPKKYKVVLGSGRVGLVQQFGALLLLVALAIALVFGVIALLPQATVTLTPVAQQVEADLVVKADPNVDSVDFQTLVFPARVDQVELDLSGQIETTDTELAPVGRATGPVVFINRTEDVHTIPISTTVSTSAGEQIEFLTTQTTTIPAGVGATTSTLVIAAEPGPKGNVRAGQINRFENRSYGVIARVINESSLGGGRMDAARIVVEADKERLRAHLRQMVQQEGLNQLEASLAEQEFIPPASLQVIVLDVSYEEFSGDFSDTFGGEMQAVVRGTVVGGYNANRLALAALQAQVPPDHELDIAGLKFGAGEVLDVQEQIVSFRIFASGSAVPRIDVHNVAEDIAWLPVGEAQSLLGQQYDLATVPGIEFQPDWLEEWLGRLPYIPLRINVVVNDAVTLMVDGG